MKRTFIFLTLIAAFLLSPKIATSTEDEAINNAREMARIMSANYNIEFRDNFTHGELNQGENYTFSQTFYSSVTYYLIAGGCSFCQDIDLEVYDGYGNLIDSDKSSTKTAVVSFTPTVSGSFYIKVIMYRASSNNVHWSLLYGFLV